ncbi:MmgE/PrpD family protein [Actinophytocola sp.]|uniref:MmgE/PrpD family protein n=1 Tax=Actinophytocola sp. TaxID=1872138 RepID=UPI003D6B5EFE
MNAPATDVAVTRELARYVVGLGYDDLPADTVDAAKDAVLDQFGIMLCGSTLPWVRPIHDLAAVTGGRAESTVVGQGTRLPSMDAAMVNAGYGHSCEFDDSGYHGGCHPGALAVPVALALAEAGRLSGRRFLLGVVLGYEVLYRIGRVITRPVLERGFHHQSVVGPFGAAAVAANLLGLSDEQALHGLSIAGSHASGTMEYDQRGGEVKRFHSAMAARAGMVSALLARHGLTGPDTILEGRRGIARLFGHVEDTTGILSGLDDTSWFAVQGRLVKLYPNVGTLQTSIQAMAGLMAEHRFTHADVTRVDAWVNPHTVTHGGSIFEPKDTIAAQFSMAFVLGVRLVHGRNELADYMSAAVREDPRVVRIGRLLHIHGDTRYGQATEAVDFDTWHGARIRVELADGRTVEAEEPYRKGSLRNPATRAEKLAKFHGLASAVLDDGRAEALVEALDRLDEVDDVTEIIPLLVGKERAR